MIKAVIIEDESKSRDVLKAMLKKYCPTITLAGEAESVEQGLALVQSSMPDLIFLDIEMPDGTGFDLLQKTGDQKFSVIFTTAYDQYAIKAIKYSALDYLLKPIDPEELKAAVEKTGTKPADNADVTLQNLQFLLQNIKKNEDAFSKITLPTGNAFEVVNIKDIIRMEADGSYTNFILSDKRKIIVSSILKNYEDILPQDTFIRVHHHHLVNINHVVRFLKEDGGYVIMSDNSKIEISRRKKDVFMQRLQNIG